MIDLSKRHLFQSLGLLAALVGALAGPTAAASDRPSPYAHLEFHIQVELSGYPIGSRSLDAFEYYQASVDVYKSQRLPGRSLCASYAYGAFAQLNRRPDAILPEFRQFTARTFDGAEHLVTAPPGPVYVWPGVGKSGPSTYSYLEQANALGNGAFVNGPFSSNEPFFIDNNGYNGRVRLRTTLNAQGDGSLVEESPHAFRETWTCGSPSIPRPIGRAAIGAASFDFFGGRFPTGGAGQPRNLQLTAETGPYSPRLFQYFEQGRHFPHAVVEVFRRRTRKVIETITLRDALIESFQSLDGADLIEIAAEAEQIK